MWNSLTEAEGLSAAKMEEGFREESFDQTGEVQGLGDFALEVKEELVIMFEEENGMEISALGQ